MDKNRLIKKMKQGDIGFIDEPGEEKLVWEAFERIPGHNIEQRKNSRKLPGCWDSSRNLNSSTKTW